jgi:hypothetical protein
LIAASDLAAAARELEARHGLASLEGGRHPGWGTANRIVPLGDTYLELVTVVDEAEAERSAFGSWVAGALPALARPFGWAVRTRAIDSVADRLGLDIADGSRITRGGRLVQWRLAGVERAVSEPTLPFFIEWADVGFLPGHAPVEHPAGRVSVSAVRLAGDAERLADWLGAHRLPIAVRPGAPTVQSIVLAVPAGEVTLAEL